MRKTSTAVAAFALTLAFAAAASAANVTVRNTGLDAAGGALAAGDGQTDGNYTIVSSTLAGVSAGPAATYYNAAYLAENAGSRWISYSGSPLVGVGYATFQTTFDLTGFDAATAQLSGMWGVDNEGDILLNGVSIASLVGTVYSSFNTLHAFSAASGFLSGVNTLTFEVHDTGAPMAFRTDNLAVTADALGVPEPAAWALMLAGFGLVGATLRRRPVATVAA